MTDDLVQRLRIRPLSVLVNPNSMCSEAADRIEAQAAEIERLREEISRTYDKAYWAGVEDGKRAALEQSK